MQITVGIITISDRASRGEYADLGGPALKEAAQKSGWNVLAEAIVPDETEPIQNAIRSFSEQGCGLVLTTGGTGIASRDVTPEAIRGLMRVELPGFGEVMRAESMKITPNAILSRNLAAVVGKLASAAGVVGRGINRLAVGIGMVPRGEVGLIFAGIGAALSVDNQPLLPQPLFSALVLMVVVTTLIAPIGLRLTLRRA